MDAKAEKIALFRYGLIARLVLEPLPHGELTRRAQEIAARHYEIPYSQRTSVSVDTLLNWTLRYREGGFEALARKPRQDHGQSRTITPQLADLIERLKRENPHGAGTTLLRELALVSGQNEPAVSASTLYRFLKQRGLTARQLLAPPGHKKFEAQHANLIGQSDMLYGPYVQRPGGGKLRAASFLMPSSTPTRDWTLSWTAFAKPSLPAACRSASTWITPKCSVHRNWPASPPRSAFWSCIPHPISRKAAARSSASSAASENSSWPTWTGSRRSRSMTRPARRSIKPARASRARLTNWPEPP